MSGGGFLALALLMGGQKADRESRERREKREEATVSKTGRGNSAIAMRSPVQGFGRGNPFFDPWAEGGKFNPKR